MIKTVAVIIGLLIVSLLGLLLTPGPLMEEKMVLIAPGSTYSTADVLEANGVIYNKQLFWAAAQAIKRLTREGNLKAGEYLFKANSSMLDIIQQLKDGDVIIRKFVVPEGYTNKQIVDLLQNTEGLNGAITLEYSEGSFLPETYFYTYGDTRDSILARMAQAMTTTLDELWAKRNPHVDNMIKTKEGAVVLASIVEEEAKTEEDRALIAAVFLNRLQKHMKLEADPTVLYAVTKDGTRTSRRLSRKDLKIQSLFNTYTTQGLPPTPISNPGLNSLKAVLKPIYTSYLFFVIRNCQGQHAFAKTLQDHNKNVKIYKKLKCDL